MQTTTAQLAIMAYQLTSCSSSPLPRIIAGQFILH